MGEQAQPLEDRRDRTRKLIDELLAERQQLLVLFCQLAGLEPFARKQEVSEQLREFCQVLVDYSALGHFELYERIAKGEERRRQVVAVAQEAYPRITEATEVAVAFNDKYDESDHQLILEQLAQDLSLLGDELGTRFELEDRIVHALLAR